MSTGYPGYDSVIGPESATIGTVLTNANAPSTRSTQYFEMVGSRAIYHDGWLAATTPPEPPWDLGFGRFPDVVNGYTWELYKLADDYSEADDLAAKMPDRLRDMQELFMVE